MAKRRSKLRDEADFHVDLDDAMELFVTLTPKRMELLQELRLQGSMSIYALGQILGRDYSNVHKDVKQMRRLGLIELDKDRKVFVPWSSVEIRFSLEGD